MALQTLFPPIEAHHEFFLQVDGIHELYVEESGNPDGIPVLFVHGGPGGGTEPWHRSFFSPQHYRIILFDQRGSGRSTPHASLEGNTTRNLLEDMEAIRQRLNIERWVLFGGSWGSTLSLAYAQTYPERVMGLVLRGIFLCRPRDIHWFYQDGASRLFPDYWQDYLAQIPVDEQDDLPGAYYKRLTSNNEAERLAAARAWSIWEGRTSTLRSSAKVIDHFGDTHTALSIARIECHYFVNNSFLEPDQLVRNAHRLRDIPGFIVQGRYDVVCPIDQAHALHTAWPQAQYTIVPDAGHSASEPGITNALITATNTLAQQLSS